MSESMKRSWMRRGSVPLILLILAAFVFLPRLLISHPPGKTVAGLQPLSLTGHQRLLIFAPHCDDETLGSAGLILAAERIGIQVRVVIATNGDGYFFATAEDFRKVYPTARDFIHMGEVRQQESLAALKILGLEADRVTFLSYPDRGTPSEWNNHWSVQQPYRSPFSQDTKSPYPATYNPNSVYAGQDYLADIISVIKNYRPDLIIYPYPNDEHPDHWGLNAFVRLAITEVSRSDPAFQPTQLTYLIHQPGFPTVKGLKTNESLVPPPALLSIHPDWFGLELTLADVLKKGQAVQAYRSQLPLLHTLMDSFVRTNELFSPVDDQTLPVVIQGSPFDPSTWRAANGQVIPPVERDPVGDFIGEKAIPGADLVAIYLARDESNILWLCSQSSNEIINGVNYTLQIKALVGKAVLPSNLNTGKVQPGTKQVTLLEKFACAQTSLANLGNPWAIFVDAGAEVQGAVIDHAGWQLVKITPAP